MATDVVVDLQVIGLTSTGEPVEYELVHEKVYEPDATEYTGKADICTMYFDALPEQIPLMDEVVRIVTEAMVENVIANDGTMLRLRIYSAKGEWYNSKWKVEATIHGSPFPWAIVIPLIVIAVIALSFVLISWNVKEMDWTGKAVIGLGLGIILLLLLFAMAGKGKKVKKTGG